MSRLSLKERRDLITNVLTALRSSSFPSIQMENGSNTESNQLDSKSVSEVFSSCCDHIINQLHLSERRH